MAFAQDTEQTVLSGQEILVLINQGEIQRATREAERLRLKAIKEHGENSLENAAALQLVGVAKMVAGLLPEAERALKEASEITEANTSDPEKRGVALQMLSAVYAMQGRQEEAQRLNQRGADLMSKSSTPPMIDLRRLSELDYSNPSDFPELEQIFLAAFQKIQQTPLADNAPQAGMAIAIASLYEQNNLCEKAKPFIAVAHDIVHEKSKIGLIAEGALAQVEARCDAKVGNFELAEKHLKPVLDNFAKISGGQSVLTASPLADLVEVKLKQGRPDEALSYARTLAEIQKRRLTMDAPSAAGLSRGTFLSATRYAFDYLLASAWYVAEREGDPSTSSVFNEAFIAAQWSTRNRAAQATRQLHARLSLNAESSATLAEMQKLQARWQEYDQSLSDFFGLTSDGRLGKAHEDMTEIEKTYISLRDALIAKSPRALETEAFRPMDAQMVQKRLDESEALILIAITKSETFVFVITKHTHKWIKTDLDDNDAQRLVSSLRCGLDLGEWRSEKSRCKELTGLEAPPGSNAKLPFDPLKAYELYQRLFGSTDSFIRGRHLLVVSYGPLASLPIHVLITDPPAAPSSRSSFRNYSWLARRQAVATLTSVAGLAGKVSTAGPAHAKLTYGGFGNPILQGNPDDDRQQFAATQSLRKQRCESILKSNSAFGTTNATKPVRFVTSVLRGESSDTKAIKFLPPLPETADEICAAASIVGNGSAEVFLGNKYTETLVKELSKSQKLKNYSTLHFATHGLMAYETEKIVGERGEPALVATPPEVVTPEDDGLLTASEISNLDLSSDWVILSACNTASGERGDVEVLSGLARAFFFAGAKSILASHWAIDSYASKLLVGAMFVKGPRLSRPERSNALRSAMMSLLNGSEEAAAHPAIWAPFVIVESGAY